MTEEERLAQIGHKRCTKCEVARPLSQFGRSRAGKIRNQCKVCRNEGFARYYAQMKAAQTDPVKVARLQKIEDRRRLAAMGMRRCDACELVLDLDKFLSYGDKVGATGEPRHNLHSTCIACEDVDVGRIRRMKENSELGAKGQRRCKQCQEVKALTLFYKAGKNRYQAKCIECYNAVATV